MGWDQGDVAWGCEQAEMKFFGVETLVVIAIYKAPPEFGAERSDETKLAIGHFEDGTGGKGQY